jgi:hypothetical protein
VTSVWLDHVAETMSFQTVLQLEPQKLLGLYGFPALTLLPAAALVASTASFAAGGLAARPLIEQIVKPELTMVALDAASSCRTVSSLAPLTELSRGRVMAPIDLGPAILAATDHSVFAAPYHRNNGGNLAMLRLMTAAPGAARQILSDHQVDYIVICTGSLEQGDFVKLAPDGLAARLGRGEVPDFLKPVDLRLPGKLVAWRVRLQPL